MMNKVFGVKNITHLLYGIAILLPILSVLGRVCYTVVNKNAKDSYSQKWVTSYQSINEISGFYEGGVYTAKYEGVDISFVYLDYIESTGTQYIDTDVTPGLLSDNLTITMEYNTSNATFTNNDNMFFGCGTPGNDVCYFVDATRNKNAYVRYYNNNASDNLNSFFSSYPNGVMLLDNNGISVDGSTPLALTSTGVVSNDLPVYIFARNGATLLKSSFKLYNFKMFKGGVIVRDFKPVLLLDTDEPCLYDEISHTFFYNQGTDDFLYGSILSTITSPFISYSSCNVNWVDYGFDDLNYVAFQTSFNGDINLKDTLGNIYTQHHVWGNTLFNITFTYLYSDFENFGDGDVYYQLQFENNGTLDNAFEYSLQTFVDDNNLGNVNLFSWFTDLFLDQSKPKNALYLNFVNWYLNYTLLVSSGYLLFMVLIWFTQYIRRIMDKSMYQDFGGF